MFEEANLTSSERAFKAKTSTSGVNLRKFANDSSRLVRIQVARNSWTPTDVLLDYWYGNPSVNIRESLARNPSTPPFVLIDICSDETRSGILRAVYGNKNTPMASIIQAALAGKQAYHAIEALTHRANHIEVFYAVLLQAGWVLEDAFNATPDEMITELFREFVSVQTSGASVE